MHGLPQFFARLDVKKRQGKEDGGEEQHHYILHVGAPNSPGTLPAGLLKIAFRLLRVASAEAERESDSALQPGFAKRLTSRLILSCDLFEYRKDFLNKS